MLLYCLPKFEPAQETEFLKYAKHYIQNGLLFCRMMVEAGSFASLAEYRHVRQIGAIYNNSAKTAQKSAIRFVQGLPETRLLKSTVVPFEMERLDLI